MRIVDLALTVMRYETMRCLLLGIFCVVAVDSMLAANPAEENRPNILYFYVDDMGWGSIGPNGQSARRASGLPSVRTPNLDRLAKQGVNFTRGYGCHVCSPARSSQQSGFHQGHTFADRNDPNNAKKAMRSDDVLIGDALSKAGYATGYWGKWGYGGSKDRLRPVIENVQTLPTSHGYQHVLAELHHVRAHTFFQPTLWHAPAAPNAVGGLELVPNSMAAYQRQGANYPATPALQNHPDYPRVAYCDDAYAFAALDFVRSQAQRYHETGQPFFGLLAVQIPHAPFDEISELPEWDQEYANDPLFSKLSDQTRQWAAMVTRIDAHFGNLLAALDDPNHDGDRSDSISDNTLVVFQSDNGGPGGRSHLELNTNGGLSGTKGKIEEGGIRVPLVMRWPNKVHSNSTLRAGTDCNRVVDVTDLLPTFCELAGAEVPLGIDGVSIAPTITGTGQQRSRDFIIHEAGNGQSIIRGRHKLIRAKRGTLRLHDLEADPSESTDVSQDHPELVVELESLLLGERVTEPKGFANTYHHWTGEDHAVMSDADNWSDYEYRNAGVTYLLEDGPPQLSWVAKMRNETASDLVAEADRDVEFLGLSVGGNLSTSARQTVRIRSGVSVNGRNEVRVEPLGTLDLDGGRVSSLRWIDIHPKGAIMGHGDVAATLYNGGLISVACDAMIRVTGDYHQSTEASLEFVPGKQSTTLRIDGIANLSGKMQVRFNNGVRPAAGDSFTVLESKKIVGKFDHSNDRLVAENGLRFKIDYSDSIVTLVAE